jgi:hypothetical protein
MIVGYARVSTDGQTLDAQQAALTEAGAERIYAEKQSGAKTDRAALARCLASLEAGDTLLVTKLDRLARSTRDLLNTLAAIGGAGASFRSLAMPGPIPQHHMASAEPPKGALALRLGAFDLVGSRSSPNTSRQRPEFGLPKARPWSRLRGVITSRI